MAPPIPAAMCKADYKAARGLSLAPQKLRQLRDIRRNPPRRFARELAQIIDAAVCGRQLGGWAPFQVTFLSRRQDYLISHVVL
jgi:hypothetical protein